MKGLLIKDIKLMLGQKRFFVVVLGMGLMLMVTGEQPSSAMGYIVMLLTIFSLSTLSYDEHENGMNFLLTLPVSRKTYVQEKYVFAAGLALTSSVFAGALASVVTVAKGLTLYITEFLAVGGVMIVLSLLIISFMMPVEIKFGAEKGRLAMFAVFAVLGVIVGISVKLLENMGVDTERELMKLSISSPQVIVAALVGITVLAFVTSYFVSVKIINKKEY